MFNRLITHCIPAINFEQPLFHRSWTGSVSLGNTTLSELLGPKSSARQSDSANTTLEIATTDISLCTR